MAASNQTTLFNQAVSRILSSWSGLQIAVEHGLGGPNSKQKALDFVDDIEDLFNRHGSIDPYDFAGLLEDEVDERFNTLLEDGSSQMIAHHICQSFMLLRDGRTAEVGKFLEGLSGTAPCKAQSTGGDDSSDEDDDGEDAGSAQTPLQQQQPSQNGQCSVDGASTSGASSGVNGKGDAGMDVDEEDDGWTVVKKGGKNSRKR